MKVFSTTFTTVVLNSVFLPFANTAVAQVTPDGTTSTTVTPTPTGVQIDQGNRAGGNLFHSFGEFSIPTGSEAYFNNANDISNIFTRVTGGNISNIDGLIRANGTANLFFINPAGILFGENARLQLGGSFYGSTADSIVFSNGEFSATDLDNPPLITINAPIGLGFRDNPGDITVRGDGSGTRTTSELIDTENGLQVNANSTLGLIGGNLNLEGATIKTAGGRIELGSVAGNETVSLTPVDEGFSFGYEGVENFNDIDVAQTATVDASGLVSGDIRVWGRNINLIDGSKFEASTLGDSPSQENPGVIKIKTTNLILNNGGQIEANTFGQGNSGKIVIDASNTIFVKGSDTGKNSDSGSFANGISSEVKTGARGNGGEIEITTTNLTLTEGGTVSANTQSQGNAGKIIINASDTISVTGKGSQSFPSAIGSAVVETNAAGNGGEIKIETANLTVSNGGLVTASTLGIGNAGKVTINAHDTISVTGIEGVTSQGFSDPRKVGTGIYSGVAERGVGNAGGIEITTNNLILNTNGVVNASTSGRGNAGKVTIDAHNNIYIEGENSKEFSSTTNISSGIFSGVTEKARGDAGGIKVTTENLTIINYGAIGSPVFGRGDGGDVNVTTNTLFLESGGTIITSNIGRGNSGNVEVTANDLNLNNGFILAINQPSVATAGIQQGGNVNLSVAENMILRNNSTISAQAFDNANGGNVDIDANFIIAYPDNRTGNDIIASAGEGKGGKIDITAEGVLNIEERKAVENNGTNDIDATSGIEGLGGTVTINTPDKNPLRENTQLSQKVVTSTVETTDTCSVSETGEIEASGLVVKGKGGVTPEPTEPISADALIVDEEATSNLSQNNNSQLNPEEIPPYIQPVAYKNNGEPIYLARGVIVQEDGTLILTAYPTDRNGNHNSNSIRTPQSSGNCSTDN